MSSDDDCIRFEHLVKLLHSISQVHPCGGNSRHTFAKGSRSLDLVHQWFNELRQHYKVIPPHTCMVFFRLFFPEEDIGRRYNLKETRLARALATDVFGLASNSQGIGEACRLMQWSEYSDARDNAKQGCLGVEVERTVASRYSARQGQSPSIQTIDALLDDLASLSGYSNLPYLQSRPRRSRASILRDLYLGLDPLEAKFMTQIILKDMRPVLYPLVETHTTKALLQYRSNALRMLSKWEVMNAWHPCMSRIYRVRATLDDAARAIESLPSVARLASDHHVFSPVLGIPIEVPKSQKGVRLTHALQFFQEEEEVWAETKYDGERMQIHVDLSRPPSQQITIFSKSKRDSTQDRMGTHPIIRASLGLAPREDDRLLYSTLEERTSKVCMSGLSSAILDAEMVCHSESKGDIDEFWRLRSLVESTARGVRCSRHHRNRQHRVQVSQSQDSTQCWSQSSPEVIPNSLQSDASNNGDRHLKIVFFDLMFLNGCSLLNKSYHERRGKLEHLINIIPGYTSLSWRQCITLSQGVSTAVRHLARIFSQHVASHQEGLVLKGSKSIYNSFKHPWVKLKRDYIPGYGDTVDLVILGASWNKVRARELRVAPETFTTFFVAALDALDKPKSICDFADYSPQFQILFTVEYGMDRDQLESLNFYIKSSEPHLFKSQTWSLPYSFRLPNWLPKPAVMFSQPLLGELFGAGFTKDVGAMYYSLRFPRLTKVWRNVERNWTAGSCLEDFQKIARMSIGRESSDEWASRQVDAMWGYDISPGPKDPHKMTETMGLWYERLLRLEGMESLGGTSISNPDLSKYVPPKRKIIPGDIHGISKRRKVHHNRPTLAQPLRALGSMTNVPFKTTTNREQGHEDALVAPTASMSHAALSNGHRELTRETANRTINIMTTRHSVPFTPISSVPTNSSPKDVTASVSPNMSLGPNEPMNDLQPHTIVKSNSGMWNPCSELPSPSSPRNLQFHDMTATSPTFSFKKVSPETTKDTIYSTVSESSWPQHYANTAISQFIRDAYVWIHRDSNNKRPTDRPPASHLVPQHRRIGVIYFLLIICGCHVDVGGDIYFRQSEQFTHVNKCVMFIKTGDEPEVQEGLDWLFYALESWRAELNKPGNKELFVFDSQMVTYSSLSTFRGDVASQALWRSSGRTEI